MKQIWTTGKHDALVCITAAIDANGAFMAAAEDEHITENQFRNAVQEEYQDYAITVKNVGGYWRADGRLKDDS